MTLFSEIFATAETKELLKFLKEINSEIKERNHKSHIFDFGIALDIISKEAKDLIFSNSKALTKTMREGKQTPQYIITNIFNKISHNKVISSDYHIYRGTLSQTGSAFYEIFIFTLLKLEQIGIYTQEQSEKIEEFVLNKIEEIG